MGKTHVTSACLSDRGLRWLVGAVNTVPSDPYTDLFASQSLSWLVATHHSCFPESPQSQLACLLPSSWQPEYCLGGCLAEDSSLCWS